MVVGGRYQVQHVLGRGGLGEVWGALDHNLHRSVAIKFVTGVVQYPEAAKRFAREARTLASLNHGGIVTVHDASTIDHDGQPLPYLVMERLNGATWETAQVDSVIETGARLADALAHVHGANIVHRDVKPANIMICEDGRTVLMDFGIARDDNSLTRAATTTGRAFGTPAYMAPEQFQGSAATPASDVYALGLVLVEKLTGQCSPAAQLTDSARATIPGRLVQLLTRMTSHLPEDRPPAAECAQQLRAPVPTPTLAVPRTRTTVPERFGPGRTVARRQSLRAGLAVPGALLALFIVSGFLRAYSWDGSPDTGSVWVGPRDGAIGWLAKACIRPVTWGRSGGPDYLQMWGGAVTSLLIVLGLAVTLALTAGLMPGTTALLRRAGYAGAALASGCLIWQATNDAPWFSKQYPMSPSAGMWFFYLTTALTIGAYIHRDIQIHRLAAMP